MEEELDPAQGDGAGVVRSMLDVLEKQKKLAQFIFCDQVRRFVVVACQLTHTQQIGFLRPERKTAQLHIFDHFLS